MLSLFKKKKKEDDEGDSEESKEKDSDKKTTEKTDSKKQESSKDSGNTTADVVKLSTEVDKLKASQEAFQEVRKSFSEKFTRISEQIGEVRAMVLDRDKTMQQLELKATKAADLVNSVEPEKLMTEIQKQEAKVEALKANLEGNESIMGRVMDELKDVRKKVEFFRGVEEIVKLSEEVKKELIEIKKIQGNINTEADKVETMYSEMRKKIQILDNFDTQQQEMTASVDQNSRDLDMLKNKVSELAKKEDLDKLISKIQNYINSMKELQKKSSLSKDIDQLKMLLDSLK